jgi:hypothetical protein
VQVDGFCSTACLLDRSLKGAGAPAQEQSRPPNAWSPLPRQDVVVSVIGKTLECLI